MKAVVKHTISLDGKIYEPGSTIELTKEQSIEFAENLDNGVKAAPILDDGEGEGWDEDPKGPNLKKMKKDDLIAILTDAKIDFDPNAKNDDLKDLIVSNVEGYKDAII